MSVEERVKSHFHADALRFDAIYNEDKGPVERFIDCVWRGVVRKRLDLTLEKFEPLAGKSVLDVGCGSGRFSLAYAQRGAARSVGVDFAPAMIELAREYARSLGVEDRCDFRVGAFPEAITDGPYDYSSANGFFDYIEDPVPLLQAIKRLTRERMVMSFPKAREWRVPIRRLRFKRLGCPLFLYTEPQVREILARSGLERFDWINLDRDYFIVCDL
jgi:ubiquinone/menaquinone biosynthesis C-methylase UbiE